MKNLNLDLALSLMVYLPIFRPVQFSMGILVASFSTKKSIVLSIAFLFMFSAVPSKAQKGVALLIAPISKITSSKFLLSLGLEAKLSSSTSFSLEYSLPIADYYEKALNKKAFSYSAEIRKYKPISPLHKSQSFFAYKLDYRNEVYALKKDLYHTEAGEEILYNYAETNVVINSLSIRWGRQRIFKTNLILELSIGLGISKKTVRFENVKEAPAGSSNFGFLDFDIGNIDLGSFGKRGNIITPQPDDQEGSHVYISIPIVFRFGILMVKRNNKTQ